MAEKYPRNLDLNDPNESNLAAWVIGIASGVGWTPAVILALASKKLTALLLPVMGLVPLPMQSGEPGYNENAAFCWGVGLFIAYLLTAAAAWRFRLISVAVIIAVLLFISEARIILVLLSLFQPNRGWA